jgi:hypothetical protein
MTLAVGLIYTPNTVKADAFVKPVITSVQISQEAFNPIQICPPQQSKEIAVNKAGLEVIGVSSVKGVFKEVYKENNFIFIEMQNSNNENQIFYAPDDEKLKNEVKNLKENMYINVKYVLGTPKESKDGMAMPLSSIERPISVLYGNEYYNVTYSDKVSLNKEWIVYLNKNINKNKLTDSNIYVMDSQGNNIPVKISTTEDNKAIRIIPVEAYKPGQTYNLIVTNNIEPNVNGLNMQFTISN